MLKKSRCCSEDMIYLGKGIKTIFSYVIDTSYHYFCSKCGNIEWSSVKEKSKYKWYKYDKEKLKSLLKLIDKEEGD